jgi:hypothetical protein
MHFARGLCVLSLLSLAGCAATKMTSMVNPEWNRTSLERVVVFYSGSDLNIRRQVEIRFAERGPAYGVEFVPSYQILFPGTEYSEEQLRTIFAEHSIDAVIAISITNAGVSSTTMPQSTSTSCTLSSTSQGCIQAETRTSGGGQMNKPWANFAITLADVKLLQTAWVATAGSGGNAWAKNRDVRNSMVDETLKQLVRDGLLRPPVR